MPRFLCAGGSDRRGAPATPPARGFLTADADLSPERRLYGSGGSGVATYRELMKNLASKSSPDGGALPKILARWITGSGTPASFATWMP